ncbi:MAG TPA: hypothetical protein VGW38_24280, partial [Chloroflexota bacterium]|nr:hypothetical protein [Chloroflexota bacterium]
LWPTALLSGEGAWRVAVPQMTAFALRRATRLLLEHFHRQREQRFADQQRRQVRRPRLLGRQAKGWRRRRPPVERVVRRLPTESPTQEEPT